MPFDKYTLNKHYKELEAFRKENTKVYELIKEGANVSSTIDSGSKKTICIFTGNMYISYTIQMMCTWDFKPYDYNILVTLLSPQKSKEAAKVVKDLESILGEAKREVEP